MNGNCQTRSVVYTGMMESDNPNPVVHGYIGSTEGTFKAKKRKHNENWKVRGDYSPMEEDFFQQNDFMWNGFKESV